MRCRQTNIQTEIKTDRQTYRQTDRYADKQTVQDKERVIESDNERTKYITGKAGKKKHSEIKLREQRRMTE